MDNILRLGAAIKEQTNTGPARAKRDWASALSVIRQAADAMSATEERAKEIEGRSRAMADRAVEELKNAERRIHAAEMAAKSAEAAARNAEARAREAEARAQEAEDWLLRFHDEIVKYLITRRGEGAEVTALPELPKARGLTAA
jgi:FKBP-type peptidyl-prolyl cis-trans isomerase